MRYIFLAGGSKCSDNENIYKGLPTEPPTTTTTATTTTTTSTTSTTTEESTTTVNTVTPMESSALKDNPSGTLWKLSLKPVGCSA